MYVIYVFSFESVSQPIPINAYVLGFWAGELFVPRETMNLAVLRCKV